MSVISQRFKKVCERITAAAVRAGRDPSEVRLVAVTKKIGISEIKEAINAGIKVMGENRVQDFLTKYKQIGDRVEWHLIGHLQRNKVKHVIGRIKLIHSLDSMRLAEEISRRACEAGICVNTLVQVNVSGEKSKYGLAVPEVKPFLKEAGTLEGIRILGLMTIAPLVERPEETRPVFREMFSLWTDLQKTVLPRVEMRYLSMGMTNDFEVAIEEGANLVRIGTALFGPV